MDLNSVEIKEIGFKQVAILVQALSNEKSEYLKYFTPFEFTVESITKIFSKAVNDKYYGIFVNEELAGFYMLRGMDEGYEIPSYGVWISSKFSNKGLSKLTLYHAFTFCKLNNFNTLMLKVHPENKVAKVLYESFGFKQTGFDDKNDNYIYHKSFSN